MDSRPARTETYVGLVILFTLAVIAAGIFLRQFHYDAALFAPAVPETGSAPASASGSSEGPDLSDYATAGLSPMSGVEVFGPETLSEKIDGKAEMYLSSGFKELRCRRFGRSDRPNEWLELFVYDMDNPRNAFAVFSLQKRADAEELSIVRFSYRTSNALYLVHGRHYVEIVASVESMAEDVLAVGLKFIQAVQAEGANVGEIGLFSPEGLDPSSVALHVSDVFGFNELDNTFTASYNVDGVTVTAFLSRRESPEDAARMAEAYRRFLVENGATVTDADLGIEGARVLKVFDTFEVVFSKGSFLAGVHEADDGDVAGRLAVRLHQGIR